jgi:FtsP/CotA-like multicopper oxidase with cupredoxin domain
MMQMNGFVGQGWRPLPVLGSLLLALAAAGPAFGQNVVAQCPPDPKAVCKHLVAGDGYVSMADGRPMYMFGFHDVTDVADGDGGYPADGYLGDEVMAAGLLAANFPAPTIEVKQGDHLYLTLTNVGMVMRPDLFDSHSVHWHGFPNAAPVFDGMPDAAIAVKQGASLTYFYNVAEPGTYMYHCHVEAAEHMQMGMLGNLYEKPAQDGTPYTFGGRSYTRFAYNDGDGSTGYDVAYPIQMSSFDPNFHDASETVAPLPFAAMFDRYPMLNGRGYPDTVHTAALITAANGGKASQKVHSLIEAAAGERILLRMSNLSVTRFYTLQSLGIPMQVVGIDAKHLVSSSGEKLYYTTNSVTLGGGQTADVILDTAGVPAGTYFLHTTNLNYLNNDADPFGGMMSEIRIQ